MLHALAFVSMFVIGGLSGVFMAASPFDIYIHDTYFIVAHLHYVLFGGSLFAIFAAVTYWYPKMFGRMMNPTLGRIHFWLTLVFYNCVFFPMHQLGLHGHMRRIYDPTQYAFLREVQPVNVFISISAFLLFATQFLFAVNFIMSWFNGEKAPNNPWLDNGLEGPCRRHRRTATSATRCRPCIVGRTSTARRTRIRTTYRRICRCRASDRRIRNQPATEETSTWRTQPQCMKTS
jgi:cytochrome c oxidase subunit 1